MHDKNDTVVAISLLVIYEKIGRKKGPLRKEHLWSGSKDLRRIFRVAEEKLQKEAFQKSVVRRRINLPERGDIIRWPYGLILGRPMNFSFIDEYVSGSAGPLSKREVNWLRNRKGIKAILSVREGPLVKAWVEGIEYLNVPVKNHFPPTLEQLKTCVDFVMNQVSNGNKVDIHCAAGFGRTGTVLAAYLCKKYGMSADEAIFNVRKKRPGSIERGQEAVIHEYCRSLKREK